MRKGFSEWDKFCFFLHFGFSSELKEINSAWPSGYWKLLVITTHGNVNAVSVWDSFAPFKLHRFLTSSNLTNEILKNLCGEYALWTMLLSHVKNQSVEMDITENSQNK